jgi:predicted SAM-dependent methyltransferase/glycosyltransferase involved in cell wall biosynthesis
MSPPMNSSNPVRQMHKIMLNIGCGNRKLPGFVNIDVIKGADIRHDVRKGIPYGDGCIDFMFSEHFLEHLTQREGIEFLRECRRVLKPGGTVRIAMPDLDTLVGRYHHEDWRGDGDMFKLGFEWVNNRCEMLNIAMREWGHRWVYNDEELKRVADLAGLLERGRMDRGVSEIPELVGLEYRPGSKLIMEFTTRSERTERGLPKVSVLIPAYRADYLGTAIQSAIGQHYTNTEIIVCDDCPTDDVRNVVTEYQLRDSRIQYVRNDPPRGPLDNYIECFSRATGEYIQFLNDDDILGERWIDEAAAVLSHRPDVTLVACAREHINESGKSIRNVTPILGSERSVILQGGALVSFLVTLGLNCIGEPSACMFRRSDIASVRPHIMSVSGGVVRGLGDLSMWITLLSKGDLAYLSSTRCKIRIHPKQWQQDPQQKVLAKDAWHSMRKHVKRLGLYDGIFRTVRLPNPAFLLRGYRWRPFGDKVRWRFGAARLMHIAIFSYRVARSSVQLFLGRSCG